MACARRARGRHFDELNWLTLYDPDGQNRYPPQPRCGGVPRPVGHQRLGGRADARSGDD